MYFEIGILRKIQQIAEARLHSGSGGHDFDHTLRVVRNSRFLLQALPEAEEFPVLAAAYLHDIARPEEAASAGKLDHAELGAPMARTILLDLGLSSEVAEQVYFCVLRHRYRSDKIPQTLEEKIVYDADKLDSLGATGIGRAFLFAGHTGARLHNSCEEALGSDAYSREDTAYREYLVKLRHLPEKLLTEPGRKRGRELAQFMEQFFAELNREIIS